MAADLPLSDAELRLLDSLQRFFLFRPVLCADGLGALERHMLEHVRQTGFALGVIYRSGVNVRMERDDRRFMAFEHDEMQAIGERKLRYALFELFEVLPRGDQRYKKEDQA